MNKWTKNKLVRTKKSDGCQKESEETQQSASTPEQKFFSWVIGSGREGDSQFFGTTTCLETLGRTKKWERPKMSREEGTITQLIHRVWKKNTGPEGDLKKRMEQRGIP